MRKVQKMEANNKGKNRINACSTYVTIPHIITIQQAMDLFEIGRTTIDSAIQSMELPAYKPNGKKYLLDAEEVFNWIKSKRYSSGYEPTKLAKR